MDADELARAAMVRLDVKLPYHTAQALEKDIAATIRAAAADARREALEEAARIADYYGAQYPTDIFGDPPTSNEGFVAAGCRLTARNIGQDIRAAAQPAAEPQTGAE